MTLDRDAPREYLVGHIEDALARDPRVSEQGLRVSLLEEPLTVVVRGTVASGRARPALAEVVGELLPGAAVRDETAVADYPENGASEVVP